MGCIDYADDSVLVQNGLTGGTTYYMSVDIDDADGGCGGSGSFCFTIDSINNSCEQAPDISSDLTTSGTEICADDQGATNDADNNTSCISDDSEIWYKFTAPSSGQALFDATSWSGTYKPTMTIYEGSCGGGLNELICSDYGDNTGHATVGHSDLTPGDTYYLAIDNYTEGGEICFNAYDTVFNNCPTTAYTISECGTQFCNNNEIAYNCEELTDYPSDLDNDDNTASPNVPGSCTGCDIDATIENNLWWDMEVSTTCAYDFTIEANNCTGGGTAAQVGLYQGNDIPTGSFTQYHYENTGFTGTVTTSHTIDPADGTVYLMFDGLSGSECDFCITVEPDTSSGCSQCTVLKNAGKFNRIAAESGAEGIDVHWLTVTEQQNDGQYFNVQHSTGNEEFETIGRVEGNGKQAPLIQQHSFHDPNPQEGINYYRIQKVTSDGIIGVSKVVSAPYSPDALEVNVTQQNTDGLQVNIHAATTGPATVQVLNDTEQQLYSKQLYLEEGNSTHTFSNITELTSGLYFIRVTNNKEVVQKKIVK
jgi:hypothetical protein